MSSPPQPSPLSGGSGDGKLSSPPTIRRFAGAITPTRRSGHSEPRQNQNQRLAWKPSSAALTGLDYFRTLNPGRCPVLSSFGLAARLDQLHQRLQACFRLAVGGSGSCRLQVGSTLNLSVVAAEVTRRAFLSRRTFRLLTSAVAVHGQGAKFQLGESFLRSRRRGNVVLGCWSRAALPWFGWVSFL